MECGLGSGAAESCAMRQTRAKGGVSHLLALPRPLCVRVQALRRGDAPRVAPARQLRAQAGGARVEGRLSGLRCLARAPTQLLAVCALLPHAAPHAPSVQAHAAEAGGNICSVALAPPVRVSCIPSAAWPAVRGQVLQPGGATAVIPALLLLLLAHSSSAGAAAVSLSAVIDPSPRAAASIAV